MCVLCEGWSRREVLDRYRAMVTRHGWAVVAVDGGPGAPTLAYTVGLTRYDGHPELLVSGCPPQEAHALLNALGRQVRAGCGYAAGGAGRTPAGGELRLLEVRRPARLVVAQEVYAGGAGLVPALQAVWSDAEGRWPWDPSWVDSHREQALFGRPLRGASRPG